MREEIAELVHDFNHQIFRGVVCTKADMNVHAKDKQSPGHPLHIIQQLHISFALCNRLFLPVGERMGGSGRNF